MPNTIDLSVVYHHEYSKGSGNRHGKNRDILFQNIHVFGNKLPKVQCLGYDETHKTENIRLKNLFLNGSPIRALPTENWRVGNFAENVTLEYDPYLQMAKNTVSAKGQLAESEYVKFDNPDGTGVRILFAGNSITLHGVRPEIGWHHAWGMAASAKEADYVHRVSRAVREKDPNAAFCICQVANWEREYLNGSRTLHLYEAARAFEADIIILRCIENCPAEAFDGEVFQKELDSLLRYLSNQKTPHVLVTTGFWHHPGDDALRAYAQANGYPCILLGDLGDDDAMKAIGLFAHEGVANHPGDLGMQRISERIAAHLVPLVAQYKQA